MLHGCTQNPTDFAKGTNLNSWAEKYDFYVLYPEQISSANSNKCWNWFEPSSQVRGSGETKLIADMVAAVKNVYPIDSSRVYVGGLSAGAAFAVIMIVTYPDVFSAAAVGAGLEWQAARDVASAWIAMSTGGPNPIVQGDSAYKAMGPRAKPVGIFVIHGTSDGTVNFKNGQQIISQFARTLDLVLNKGEVQDSITDVPETSEEGTAPGGRSFILNTYEDSTTGQPLMKFLVVNKMGHAWSGGNSSGTYTDPQGPDASQLMVDFFFK